MTVLIDTNILLRLLESRHSQHSVASAALQSLRQGGYDLVILPQVVYEFWVVATRPVAQNGLGLSSVRAAEEVAAILQLHSLFYDDRDVYDAWIALVSQYQIVGKSAHDARLVAAMMRHEVTHLLTFNTGDFSRFREITAIKPDDVDVMPTA